MQKVTVKDIIAKKEAKQKITMLTCYDASFARILDATGIDILLVGDSLANVVLGLDETRKVPLTEMLNHTRAVAASAKQALVVADMPYKAYQKDPDKALYYARKFLACGADAVKIEWFSQCRKVVKKLVSKKIAVMGHIGLTPQTVHLLGGFRVQGRNSDSAQKLLDEARLLEELGVFSLVVECVPSGLGRHITASVRIPTIGIGAGKGCDGQVLVLYDMLGLYGQKKFKFVRAYTDLSTPVREAVGRFISDVRAENFPGPQESYE